MIEWWNALDSTGRFFAYIALPTTFLLILQTIMALFGIGDDGSDMGLSGDAADMDVSDGGMHDAMDGIRLITFRGIVSFLVMFGWVGLVLNDMGMKLGLTLTLSTVAGLIVMIIVAFVFKSMFKLQYDGTMNIKSSIGVSGSVYITIPANRGGFGKVNLLIQGRYTEMNAVTDEDEDLKFGVEVTVIGISGGDTLLVKKK